MNKKALYESIMRQVAIEVKKALNESFEFEPAEALNAIVKALKDERLAKVVGNINCDDIRLLVNEIAKLAKNEIPAKAPLRISSMNALATWILVKHFNEDAVNEINEMGRPEINDLVNCVCTEFLNKEPEDENPEMNDIESKPQYNQEMNRNLPAPQPATECNNAKNECNCTEKKSVKECGEATNESLSLRRRRLYGRH